MLTRMRTLILLALPGLFLVNCQSVAPEAPVDVEALQNVGNAFIAYERGDCATASRLSDPSELAGWEATEIRHSMLLLNGFCEELDGDLDAAREIYDRLIEEAPGSFAARDAKERSRIIRINESDPSHASWMREARDRAMSAESSPSARVPVERQAANFPPLAQMSGVGGYAVVEFGVTPAGNTTDPIVIESAPPLLFDGVAVRAIRRWEYTPQRNATKNDIQVIRLLFRSEDPESRSTDAPPLSDTTDSEEDR